MHKRITMSAMVLTALLLIAVVLPACSSSSSNSSGGTSGTITEAGSTTVQPVAEKLAGAFKAKNPNVEIVIQGGGSSVGVKSAAEGTVDIGAASRELKDNEKGTVVPHLLARDGIAIVTAPGNSVTGLTKEQVKKIFMGEIKKWSEVGGTGAEIHVVAREEGSGTRAAFEEMVMGEEVITKTAILQPSNGAIRTTVTGDPNAIGFLSFGYIDQSVKALAIDGIEGTAANAKAGKYPIVRPLYFLTKSEPTGLVKAFLDFCTGPEGQKIVEEEGYLSIR